VRLYLIDASIYIFQAHFSPYVNSQSVTGADRSAFVGFGRFLLRFMNYLNHNYSHDSNRPLLAVAFDHSLFSGFRHQLYAGYKANRELPDDDLSLQLEACFDFCAAHGVLAFGSRVYEADDIIGTLAARAKGFCPVTVISRDKDLAQLLREDNSYLWDFASGQEKAGRQQIWHRLGVFPEQIPCYLGLAGDPVDCIPGVHGIGPVSARSLISHFGDLESVYANLDQVAGLELRGAKRLSRLLAEHKAEALLSRELATIVVCEDNTEAFARVQPGELVLADGDPDLLESVFVRTAVPERVQASLRRSA